MRKLILYIACSLDGKIAKPDGDLQWLESIPKPEESDYGYQDLLDSVDTVLMGYKTFEIMEGFDMEFPYKEKLNYVFTHDHEKPSNPYVKLISGDIPEFVKNLKQSYGKDIWLIGGSQINTILFNAELIDEMIIFVMPVVIGDGIPLFDRTPLEKGLHLVESQSYSSGVVMLKYNFV